MLFQPHVVNGRGWLTSAVLRVRVDLNLQIVFYVLLLMFSIPLYGSVSFYFQTDSYICVSISCPHPGMRGAIKGSGGPPFQSIWVRHAWILAPPPPAVEAQRSFHFWACEGKGVITPTVRASLPTTPFSFTSDLLGFQPCAQ